MRGPGINRRVALAGGLALATFGGPVAWAQTKSDARWLLTDLPGWDAPPATITNSLVQIMIQREYTRDTSTVLATWEIGLLGPPTAYAALETHAPGQAPRKGTIEGFAVQRVHIRDDDSGAIVVTLTDGRRRPSAFLVEYDSLDPDEAMEIARQFDWLAMQQTVSTLR